MATTLIPTKVGKTGKQLEIQFPKKDLVTGEVKKKKKFISQTDTSVNPRTHTS